MSLIAPPLLRRALPALPASWTLPSSWNPVPSLKRAVLEWAPSTETTLADTFLRMGRGDPKTKKGKVSRVPLSPRSPQFPDAPLASID